ncbi:cellulase family glycosylhydrolase [Enterococcus sp. LJL120]
MEKIKIKGQKFLTESGKEVIFNGLNLVEKNRELGHITPGGEALFQQLGNNGINLIRLGLFWKAVEPKPNEFDLVYLEKLKEQVRWAKNAGIYVFIDMHQDLYSEKFGDGAPLWATLDDGLPHVAGQLWSDTYQLSEGLNRAIDHFWENAPAADGIGLQDHYTEMWKFVANFFKDEENVIGFDLMNEPYPGSSGTQVRDQLIGLFMHRFQLSPEELMAKWLDDAAKQELLGTLADLDIYKQALGLLTPIVQEFEKNILQPFFDKLETALLPLIDGKLIFLETSFFNNIGIPSALTFKDNQQEVFAPHAYDLVFDTTHFENYSTERIENTLMVHREVQKEQNVPVVLGEWGAYFQDPETQRISQIHIEYFENYLWGHTYWSYYHGYFESPTAAVLNRPYPQMVAGVIERYHYDYQNQKFTLRYQAKAGESVIYLPDLSKVNLELFTEMGLTAELHAHDNSAGGSLMITASEDELVELELNL